MRGVLVCLALTVLIGPPIGGNGSSPINPPATPIFVLQSPPRNRIAPDIPTVADAQLWARQTLNPADYHALWEIVWNESSWRADAWNRGACGLGQFWPCSKMSATLPDWRSQPIAQLGYVIRYARHKYGSLPLAWAFWARHGWW